jgi:uncharacterized protein HemY
MKLLRGTYGRLAAATGYSADYVRAVYQGRRRNAILEALLEIEVGKWEKAERTRRRLKDRGDR